MSIKRTIIATVVALALVAVVAPVGTQADTISDLMTQIAALQAQIQSLSSTSGSSTMSTGACAGVTFTRNLTVGSTGQDVECLQVILNASASTQVATTGAGSPGNETMYFGPRTLAAVQIWQAAQGFTPANQIGPLSRAKLNAWLAGNSTSTTTTLPQGCTSSAGFSPVTGQSCATGVVTQQTGPVSAMISSDNPQAGAIVSGQATADLLHITFTGSGTVQSVTLQRTGISDANTLTNVYLYQGNVRLTDGYSFNTNGTITINNLNLAVNGSTTVDVKADVSSTITGALTVGVTLTGYQTLGSSSMTTVSLAGNIMAVLSGSTLASVTFNSVNTGAGGPTGTPTVNAGTMGYTFWSNSVQINTHAVTLNSAMFRMVGSAPSDAIANIRLYIDGLDSGVTGTVTATNGSNYAVFDFSANPLTLSTGTHTIDLRGDIQKGANRTIEFSIQQASDLMIHDPQVGVNIAIGTSGSGALPSNGGTVTIATGSATVNLDPTFQSITNITGGASNVDIAKFVVHAYGEDVKVNNLSVTPVLSGMTPAAAGLQNVTIYFNGSQVGSQQNWLSGALPFTLGSQMIAPAGQDSSLEVRADLREEVSGTNYTLGTVSANLNMGTANAQGQSSLNTVNFPSADVDGNSLSLQTGTLSVSQNAGYADQSVTPNTTAVRIGSFVLQNTSTSEAVRLTNLAVTMNYGAGAGSTNYSALYTSVNTSPIQPSTAAASSSATDNFSVNLTLAPGATQTIDIFANSGTANGGTVTVRTGLVITYIGTTSNVSATAGTTTNGQLITFGNGTLGTAPTLVSSSSSTAQYIAAGSSNGVTDASGSTFNFVSTGGVSTISELKFLVTASTGTPVSSIKVTNPATNAVVSAPVVGGYAYLTGLGLIVPNSNGGLNVTATASYGPVGTSGVASGTTAKVSLAYVKYTSGGTTATLCSSTIGGCTATMTGGGTGGVVDGGTMTLVGSKPSVSLLQVTNTLSAGDVEVADVKVTADPAGDINVDNIALSFTGNAAGTHISPSTTFTVENAQGTVISNFTAGTITGNGTSAATAIATFTGGYRIAAGSSETFRVIVRVSALAGSAAGDSVATSVTQGTFAWTDIAGNGSEGAQAGTLITGFPTTSVLIKTN